MLKIAQEFIPSGDGSSEDWAFAHSIVALGRTLDLRIVAEGIEQPEQLDRLRLLGCEFGQGYLFARPIGATGIERVLRSGLTIAPMEAPAQAADPGDQPLPPAVRRGRVEVLDSVPSLGS